MRLILNTYLCNKCAVCTKVAEVKLSAKKMGVFLLSVMLFLWFTS